MRLIIAAFFALLPLSARADYRPVGQAQAEHFDAKRKAWAVLPVLVDFDAAAEQARVRLPKALTGQTITARLDFKRLPHYSEWLAYRQAQGGASWTALKLLLDEVGDGPALALTHEALPATGNGSVLVGLRRGSQFDLYATIHGRFSPCGPSLCFEPQKADFAHPSAALAWSLFKPLAVQQAKAASSR